MVIDYSNFYKEKLVEDVIPFWVQHSINEAHGGYYTCLDREGRVYDTDKFMWLQARQVWTFSMLYNKVERRESWLEIAKIGAHFLKEHGRDEHGNFYFSTTERGQPLTQAYNIYTDCFASAAFGAYGLACDDQELLAIAEESYHHFMNRSFSPKGHYDKSTGVRALRSFGIPMMTAWLTQELDFMIPEDQQRARYESCLHEILNIHLHPHTHLIHEHVAHDGKFIDTYEGRLINPGHGLEAMWFAMDMAVYLDMPEIIDRCVDICISILTYSWDEAYGGIFYFLDAKGAPLQQLEWDQKLWWVHQEALIVLSRAYLHSQRSDIWDWYQKIHDYSWGHFYDSQYGEWYGYLNRQGVPHTTLKGGKWKGCFHTPRTMYECWRTFEKIKNLNLTSLRSH